MIKYTNFEIVFQEVPDEVTLAFNISGCPHNCEGCHSPFLREDIGESLLKDIRDIIEKYKDYISCVCFMGGDHEADELNTALYIVKSYGLKTCLYSGEDNIKKFMGPLTMYLDYLKIGHYDEAKGPLNSKTTNQKFFKLTHSADKATITDLKDITKLFWKEDTL